MYGGIQNPSECLFLINLTTPFHYLGCRRISIAQCNEYHLETFWQYYVSPEPLIYSIPPPEIFSGVDFILYVCPTVQPSQVSQSPDESGLGNQLSSQPREFVSPSKREFLQKYRQSTLGVSADWDQYIFMSPGTTLESMNRHTTLCKMNIAKFETFVLIVTKVKKLNMGWKETLK